MILDCQDVDPDEACERCHFDVADYQCEVCGKRICTTCGTLQGAFAYCEKCLIGDADAA